MPVTTDIAYATERLTEKLWSELMPLLEAHYLEVAHYPDMALKPDRFAYQRMDGMGVMRIFTARNPDDLIGYMVCFIAPSLHYSEYVFASQDILFVAKQFRGSRIGVDLLKFSHHELKTKDRVAVVFQHTKAKPSLNIGPMLKRFLGYELVDEIWAKRLDKE